MLGHDQQRLDVEEVWRGDGEVGEDDAQRDQCPQPHDHQHDGMLPVSRLSGRGRCCVWRGHDACFLVSPVRWRRPSMDAASTIASLTSARGKLPVTRPADMTTIRSAADITSLMSDVA